MAVATARIRAVNRPAISMLLGFSRLSDSDSEATTAFALVYFLSFFFLNSRFRFFTLPGLNTLPRETRAIRTRIGNACSRRCVESNVFQETVSRSTVPSLKKMLFKQKYVCVSESCARVCAVSVRAYVCMRVCACMRERMREKEEEEICI